MISKELKKALFISFLITTGIGAILGYALAPIFGGWVNAFIFSFILQVFGNYIYNDYRINKREKEEEIIYNERLEILSRNLVKFNCPCGQKMFDEIVYTGIENVFKCDKCEQEIRLDIAYTPVIITAPLTTNPLEKIQDISGKE